MATRARIDTDQAEEVAGAAYLRDHEDRLAWIMGSSRSGSTWLLQMLSELDRVTPIDDPHLGHHLGVWRPLSLAWAIGTEPPSLTTLDRVKRDEDDYFFSDRHRRSWMPGLRDLITDRFGAKLPPDAGWSHAPPVVVVKEPGSQAAPILFDLFPRSRLVFLLRDGRDVVDSWLDAYRSRSWAIEEGAFAAASEEQPALAAWLGSVWAHRTRTLREVFSKLPTAHRVLVRYESLLADTTRELARVSAGLGLTVPTARLDAIAERHAYATLTRSERGPLRAVRSAEPGRWRRRPSDVRRAMHEAMAEELGASGYLPAGSRRHAA